MSILLTGASGVIGSALLRELDAEDVVCLTHRAAAAGGERVQGDVGAPRLGLSAPAYRDLASRVDTIVHCAAVTDFTVDGRTIHDVNVGGTERVLELAADAGARLHHVSTAFVRRRDRTREGEGTAAYVTSKIAAEELVRASGLGATIIRPSIVMGDSRTGEIGTFQGLHALAGAALRNMLPLLPLRLDGIVDFLPQDVVARHIAAIVRSGRTDEELWLTAGERSIQVRSLLETTMGLARKLGLAVDRPRVVEAEFVERLMMPAFFSELPERGQRQFAQLLELVRLFEGVDHFPSSLPELETANGIEPVGDLEDAFERSMRFWAARKGLVATEVAA